MPLDNIEEQPLRPICVKEIIKTYFPQASDQTIVLSTDSEIYGKYYAELKKNIGREFTLDYNDETKSTTILDGYRWEE